MSLKWTASIQWHVYRSSESFSRDYFLQDAETNFPKPCQKKVGVGLTPFLRNHHASHTSRRTCRVVKQIRYLNPPCSSCSPFTGLLPTPQMQGKNSIKKMAKHGNIPPLVAMNRLDQPWFSWLVWGIAGIAQFLANTYWTIDALYLKYYTHCSYTSDVWKETINIFHEVQCLLVMLYSNTFKICQLYICIYIY